MASARKPDLWTLLVLAAMYLLLLGNLAWYWSGGLPWPFHFAISVLAVHLSFTVWHEAVHRSVFRSAGWNDVVGVLGMFPYMTPYFIQKWVHLQHHARLNELDDPNLIYADGPFWKLPLRYPRALGYARKLLKRDPREGWQRVADAIFVACVVGIFAVGIWAGVFWDLVLLWLLPVGVAKVIMDWYINYLPHVGLPPHRYGGTRVVDVAWLTPLVLAHNYHAVHHLWPTIPWHGYRKVFREKVENLRKHGVPIETRVFAKRYVPRGAELSPQASLPR